MIKNSFSENLFRYHLHNVAGVLPSKPILSFPLPPAYVGCQVRFSKGTQWRFIERSMSFMMRLRCSEIRDLDCVLWNYDDLVKWVFPRKCKHLAFLALYPLLLGAKEPQGW